MRRYDRSTTLFYLDPPYYGSEGDDRSLFRREEYVELAT
jgi:DNA adenine methylase